MAVADILRGVGNTLATAGRVGGAVAEPILKRTALVASGEAPQIDQEERARNEKLEDQQLATKAALLEQNLLMGQTYGTLTPEQQQQYVDAITGLYSHPRHQGTLMAKLRKVTAPQGAFAGGPLPSPAPAGGTLAAETAAQVAAQDAALNRQLAVVDERAKAAQEYPRSPSGKTPPIPGNQLPPDAIGSDDQPIPASARTVGTSYIGYGGKYYVAPKPKPIFHAIGGNVYLMDPVTGLPERKLGPASGVKMTAHDSPPFVGDDGLMHTMKLYSVTTPQGESIDVEPDITSLAQGGAMQPQPEAAPQSGTATPNTPAKRVANILKPATGAQPAAGAPKGPVVAGRAIPGTTQMALNKDPLYRSKVESWRKVADDANAKQEAYKNAQRLLADNSRVTDLSLAYEWVRANVQGAGRMTNTEIQQTYSAGGFETRVRNMISQAQGGRFAPELEQQFLRDIQGSAVTAQGEADSLQAQLRPATGAAPNAQNRSIQAAMALPINKGKTREQVVADLRQRGYNPVEP